MGREEKRKRARVSTQFSSPKASFPLSIRYRVLTLVMSATRKFVAFLISVGFVIHRVTTSPFFSLPMTFSIAHAPCLLETPYCKSAVGNMSFFFSIRFSLPLLVLLPQRMDKTVAALPRFLNIQFGPPYRVSHQPLYPLRVHQANFPKRGEFQQFVYIVSVVPPHTNDSSPPTSSRRKSA